LAPRRAKYGFLSAVEKNIFWRSDLDWYESSYRC